VDVLAGLAVLGPLAYCLYRAGRAGGRVLGRAVRATPRPAIPTPAVPPGRPRADPRRRRQRDAQSRAFQTALLQLAQAPDFRRAASLAAAAALVPAAFKRRQFARFRPCLLAHYRRRTAAGADPEALLHSLRELVVALGVAGFEADYIRAEAAAQTPPPAATSPADRVAALRRDHEARVAAARQGVGEAPDLLDQLLEAEDQRFRDALLALFDDPAPTPGVGPPG
jgi:hypothetical protein